MNWQKKRSNCQKAALASYRHWSDHCMWLIYDRRNGEKVSHHVFLSNYGRKCAVSLIYQKGLNRKVLKQVVYTIMDEEIVFTVKVPHVENCLVLSRSCDNISKFNFFFVRVCCDWLQSLCMNVILSSLYNVLWFVFMTGIGSWSFKTLYYFFNSTMIKRIIWEVWQLP